jgi:enoyl-[acyl-carrier protein] reductase I
MPATKPSWKPNEDLAVGKGATLQQFFATVGPDRLEIEVAPWGEGTLKVNGVQIATVSDRKDRREAFRDLRIIAERHMRKRAATPVAESTVH